MWHIRIGRCKVQSQTYSLIQSDKFSQGKVSKQLSPAVERVGETGLRAKKESDR